MSPHNWDKLEKQIKELRRKIFCGNIKTYTQFEVEELTPKCPRIIFNEDEQALQIWDGQNWVFSDRLTDAEVKALKGASNPSQTNAFVTQQDLLSVGIGTNIFVVADYNALPDPTQHSGEFYWTEASVGTPWLPGNLGGSYRKRGLYYSNGTEWKSTQSPYQATQGEVDAGVNNTKFVTPLTLGNSVLWGQAEGFADDAEKHAQQTTAFTDSDGVSFPKGAQGWSLDAEAAKNAIEGKFTFVDYSDGDLARWDAANSKFQPVTAVDILQSKDNQAKAAPFFQAGGPFVSDWGRLNETETYGNNTTYGSIAGFKTIPCNASLSGTVTVDIFWFIPSSTSDPFSVALIQDANNYLELRVNRSGVYVYEVVGGVETFLISQGYGYGTRRLYNAEFKITMNIDFLHDSLGYGVTLQGARVGGSVGSGYDKSAHNKIGFKANDNDRFAWIAKNKLV